MRVMNKLGWTTAGWLFWLPFAFAHGPQPMPLQNVPIPKVFGTLGELPVNFLPIDGSDPIVVDKQKAIALGKALFWDVNVGSDGMACGSCHFHAGADSRVKNQMNPGLKSKAATAETFERLPSSADSGGPNYTLKTTDFPTFRFNDPLNKASGISFATDDVVSSSGTFSGNFTGVSKFTGEQDQCARSVDPIFHVDGTGTRRVEPRNAPTVVNAIFNHRNFWDGRANNIYNGVSPWGDRDVDAGVWVKTSARNAAKKKLRLENASLASLSMGPALSDVEMSCASRKWPNIGRKLLLRQPLQGQKVHNEDSVLGALSLSTPGSLKPGLNTTYKNLIMGAFNPKFWSFSSTGPFGAAPGQEPYNQMEANFSMFFGIALQLYQGTLVSDQAPIDLTPRDPFTHLPTWEGMGKTQAEIDSLNNGLATFTNNHCNLCHSGPALTTAAITLNSTLVDETLNGFYGNDLSIPYGPDALGPDGGAYAAGISPHVSVVTRNTTVGGIKLMDLGFANTGVADPAGDPGIGDVDDFGNPLSYSDQYVQYLLGNYSNIKDKVVKSVRSCDFLVEIAKNVSTINLVIFTTPNGIQADGSREGVLKNQDCINDFALKGNIPTIAAANASLSSAPLKLGVAKKATFKIPGLRNIELTGPYMHNGSMSTLEQVLEFYSRKGNNDNPDRHTLVSNIALANAPEQRADLLALLKSFTDERVRYEKAPFDHPEIKVPNGHAGDHISVTAGNPLSAELATEEFLVIPPVGANGSQTPLLPFESYLQVP